MLIILISIAMEDDCDLFYSETEILEPSDCNKRYCNSNLKMIQVNIRSVVRNFDNFVTFLMSASLDPDLIILTECWLENRDLSISLDGYKMFQSSNHKNRSEGVIVFVRESLGPINNVVNASVANVVSITCLKSGISFLGMYRSPSQTDMDEFLRVLDRLLTELPKGKINIIAGDFNINILEKNKYVEEYKCLLSEHGFVSTINKPTRETQFTKTCIDHIFVRSKINFNSGIIRTSFSDHYTTIIEFKEKMKPKNGKIVNKINFNALLKELERESWSDVFTADDPNLVLECFIRTLRDHIKRNTLTKTIPNSRFKIKPWITDGLLKCIRKRDRLHRQTVRFPLNEELARYYSRYKGTCHRTIKTTKMNYYKRKIEEGNHHVKTIWNVVREYTSQRRKETAVEQLRIDGGLIDDKLMIAECMNEYFVNVGSNVSNNILNRINRTEGELVNEFVMNEGGDVDRGYSLIPITEYETMAIINSIRTDSAAGPDGVSAKILKIAKHHIVYPLTHMINISIGCGVFPRHLKEAVIIPIYKEGDCRDPCNYRPIALLNVISKIYEKAVNLQLIRYFEDNSKLSKSQFGFRTGKGTNDAIAEVTELLTGALDNREKCIGVYLDLAKAFDSVSHPILIKKLQNIGLSSSSLRWFESYLTERRQAVRINNITSQYLPVRWGIPQGSVLGPTLFIAYINDIIEFSSEGRVVSFADDTVLLFRSATWTGVFETAEGALNEIKILLDKSLLSLNAKKTKYMTFSMDVRQQPGDEQTIRLHECGRTSGLCACVMLDRVNTYKYLGINIDNNLRWTNHVDILAGRIRRLIYVFRNLREILDGKKMKAIYYSLAQSRLMYGILGWGGMAKTNLHPLNVAQRALLRVMYRRPYGYPSDSLYLESAVLDVRQLYMRELLKHTHRNLARYSDSQNYVININTRNRPLLRPKRVSTAFAQRHFVFLGPRLYSKVFPILSGSLNPAQTNLKSLMTRWLLERGRVESERELTFIER
jgi:hypothetical protein